MYRGISLKNATHIGYWILPGTDVPIDVLELPARLKLLGLAVKLMADEKSSVVEEGSKTSASVSLTAILAVEGKGCCSRKGSAASVYGNS